MKTLFPLFFVTTLLVGTPLLAQCAPSHGGHSSGHSYHDSPEPSRPRTRAKNTLCPVMTQPVTPGVHPETLVEGRFYLLCCAGCAPELVDHPEKYLDREGRPLNDKKRPEVSRPQETVAPAPQDHSGHQH
jgi:hypothetical protein